MWAGVHFSSLNICKEVRIFISVPLKGQCHKIFDFGFSTWTSFPQLYHLVCFDFFLKFAEIFAAQGAPPVSLTPVANGKNLQ
jgi:hypothetical protein